MFAADNAGNALGGIVIGDHRHLRRERIGLAVKGRNLFAVPRHARPDIALHLVRIEDMQRPAIGKGDVVGDVDQRGNRPQAQWPSSRRCSHSGEGPFFTPLK